MGVKMELIGVDTAKKILKNYSSNVIVELGNQVEITARAIEQTAKRTVPVDTGRLRASIRPMPLGWSLEKRVEARTHYAIHVEFNNRSYMRVAFKTHKRGFLRAVKRILSQ